MIAQVIFWVYICFGTSIIGAPDSEHQVQIRNVPGKILQNGDWKPQRFQPYIPPDEDNSFEGSDQGLIRVRAKKDELIIPENHKPVPLILDKGGAIVAQAENSVNQADNKTWIKLYYNALLGHTILPRDASFVLYGNFLKNPVNLCKQHADLDLVVVVHTAPYHFERRRRLREVFGNPAVVRPYTTQLVFAIGTFNASTVDPDKQIILEDENTRYGDFVQMDFQENFRNLSYKAVMWLRWLDENCPNAMMVLKIDDDVILDLRRILPLSRGLFSKYKRSIFCHINKEGTQPIPRIGRTLVDPREFAGVSIYPYTYCSGFIVFLSRDMIPVLWDAVKRTPFYNVDDLFMFGMVPKIAGRITYHNIGFNVSLWNRKVYSCTILHRSNCQYFGTMAQDEKDVTNMYEAIERTHARDFHYPQLTIVK